MNTFALPSHCCPPTYLGNKTIIQWRDNDFRDQTTFEFQIGHTKLMPCPSIGPNNFRHNKNFLDMDQKLKISNEITFLAQFKTFWSLSKSVLEGRRITLVH